MLMFVFFPFGIFGSLEPISDSAHVLGVIDEAMGQLDELKQDHFIDENGTDIPLTNYDIAFSDVSFGYDSRTILKGVSFRIPEHTTTAIVGPSGSGKTTICNLLARFYDVNSGSITVGGHACCPIWRWYFRMCICSTIPSAPISVLENRMPPRRR